MSDLNTEVKSLIKDTLKAFASNENVHILLAIEAGSHAWGWASPVSDYDVKFVFVHKYVDEYVRIDQYKENLDHSRVIKTSGCRHEIHFEAKGFELRKFLKMLRSCNRSSIEWLCSSFVYIEEETFTHEARYIMATQNVIGLKSLALAYFSTFKSHIKEHLGKDRDGQWSPPSFQEDLMEIRALSGLQASVLIPPHDFNVLRARTATYRNELPRTLTHQGLAEVSNNVNTDGEMNVLSEEAIGELDALLAEMRNRAVNDDELVQRNNDDLSAREVKQKLGARLPNLDKAIDLHFNIHSQWIKSIQDERKVTPNHILNRLIAHALRRFCTFRSISAFDDSTESESDE